MLAKAHSGQKERKKEKLKKMVIEPKSSHIQKALGITEGGEGRRYTHSKLNCLGLSGPEKSFFLLFRILKLITLVKDPSFTTFHVYRWPDLAILNVKGIRNLAGGKHSQK